MTQQIGLHYYVCGAGNAPNREIKFYGDGKWHLAALFIRAAAL